MRDKVKIQKKLDYLQELYNLAFDGLESETLNLDELKWNLEFVDNQQKLIQTDRNIYEIRKVLKVNMQKHPEDTDIKDLCDRLHLVHKSLFKLLQDHYFVASVWPNKDDNLEYLILSHMNEKSY